MLLEGRHQIKVFPLSKNHTIIFFTILSSRMVINNNVYVIEVSPPTVPSKNYE